MKRKGLHDEEVSERKRRGQKRRGERLRARGWMKKAFPGCLLQVDTKHLRCGGRKYYPFTAIDCFSRLSFSRAYSSASSACAERFFAELKEYMPFFLPALKTDDGSEFLKDFDQATEKELITHSFSHAHCPKDNAFLERKIQTEKHELWAFREGYTVEKLNQILDGWNFSYNHVRPHQGLGYLTPMELLRRWMEESEQWGWVSTM